MNFQIYILIIIVGLFSRVHAEVGLDGMERESSWPSRFLENGEIPDHVAIAEINETISSVVGANRGASISKLEEGLNRFRELHLRMGAAKANETYLMKLTYFLVRQFTLVFSQRGDAEPTEMVNQFLSLEAWFYRNTSAANQMVPGFQRGLSAMREDIKKYALDIYRLRKLEITKEQFHEGYANLLSDSTGKVRGVSGQCANQNFARSDCYECASYAVERALHFGFKQSDPWENQDTNRRLNYPQYANQFHKGWIEEVDRKTFRLTRVFAAKDHSQSEKLKGMQTAMDAPKGSVLVWNICGTHPAGHIAVKTSATVAASSFSAPIQRTCSNPRTQIIGVYAPVNNLTRVEPVQFEYATAEEESIEVSLEEGSEGYEEKESEIAASDLMSGLEF